MKQQFVTYEIALKLKELGFDEECFAAYMKDWLGDSYILELNPLKLDDRTNYEPLKTFYNNLDSFDVTDTVISYNFNERFNETDGEGNPYDEIYSAPLWQQVIDYLRKNGIYVEICFADKALTQYEFFVFRTYEEQVRQIIRNIKIGDSRLTYKSYEEAREQSILKAIELVIKKYIK